MRPMNTKEQKRPERQRKPYLKPDLRRVQLKPEESLVGGCKVSEESAASSSICMLDFCQGAGS
jgi:hypothetical protein